MHNMRKDDWLNDDTLSKDEIQERMRAEGWETVTAVSFAPATVAPRLNGTEASDVWLMVGTPPRELCAPGTR